MQRKDLFGKALFDFITGNQPENIITWTTVSPPEILRTSYLFRSFDEMPEHERLAIEMSKGRILDVGAGSGVHALELQKRGYEVIALDISPGAFETMKKSGVKKPVLSDIFSWSPEEKFDTILLLMNGAGMAGKAEYLPVLLKKLEFLIHPGGKIMVHTSDISYLYDAYQLEFPRNEYYGNVMFYLKYKGECEYFPWTYVDLNTFSYFAEQTGFTTNVLYNRDNDVLLQLSK